MRNPAGGAIRRFFLVTALLCMAVSAYGGAQSRDTLDRFAKLSAPLGPGARVKLERVAIGDRFETLELEPFEVWAPNAEIVVEGEGGKRTRIAPPDLRYFRGAVAGDPESMVFLSIGPEQGVAGWIIAKERRYAVGTRFVRGRARREGVLEREVLIDEIDVIDDYAPTPFECGVEGSTISPARGRVSASEDAQLPITSNGALSGTGVWTLNLAIDTDYELYVDLGSSSSNVTTYIGNLVGAASTIYRRDLRTELLVAFSRVHTTSSDPFTVVPGTTGTWNGSDVTYGTGHALAELGDLWHNSPPFAGARSDTILLSGKNTLSGVAWLSTTCGGDFLCNGGSCGNSLYNGHYGGAYAFCGLGNPTSTVPDPNATNNGVLYGLPASNYWPLMVLAHELGHNVGSNHTHCVALSEAEKTQWGVTRNYVDECYNGQGGCFSGTTSIPAEKGSIMSYCHLQGSSQSRYTFGNPAETSQKIVNTITAFLDARTPASPSITAPASLAIGASDNASINAPVGGQTYTWTAVNATINGSSTGTTINFTANADPVTLLARATNTNGCSASDSVNVTAVACTGPSISTHPQNVSLTSGATHTLTVVAGGTGLSYQWYIGATGDTSSPTGTSSASLAVTPGATTSYWVRVNSSCGSIDSAAATVTVVSPPTTNTRFYTFAPCRLVDTRGAAGPYGGPALDPSAERVIQASGACGIPSTAKSIAVNITAVNPPATGWMTLFPSDATRPLASTINYRASRNRANNAIVPLSAIGQFTVYNLNAVGATHFTVDVSGYFE